MNKQQISEILINIVGANNVKIDELMKKHTSFKVGGPADILVTPENVENLAQVLRACKEYELPLFIMGNGTNLIVRDKGIRGIVVKIFDKFDSLEVRDDVIEAEAGVLLSRLSNSAYANDLKGLEFASGIPGTLGGAVAMNAGAYGGEMKDVVFKTTYIDGAGDIKTLMGEQHQFGYRTSFIQKQGGIVLKTELKLIKENKENIKLKMDDLRSKRKEKQPLEMPSAGSVFKRPEGYFAGKLVEDCGMRGYNKGGAQVSAKHCGFIVNTGNASAEDILNLICEIKDNVKGKFGVELQTEVKIVGEE